MSLIEQQREYGAFLDKLPLNSRHWTLFLVCAVAFAFDFMDFQIMALVAPSIAKEWQLTSQTLGLVLSATAVGMLLGSYLFGIFADAVGRRVGFQITVGIFAVFSGLCALAQSVLQLAGLRFVTGLGIGGFVPIDTALMSEYMPARRRGQMLALWALFFPVGGLLAAGAGMWIVPNYGWRALFLLGVLPAIMIFFVRLLIPESPRYLLQRQRIKEARESMSWIAKGQPLPTPKTAPHVDVPAKSTTRISILTLFASGYRARTLMITSVWFFWSFSFFGVLLWLPTLLVQLRGVPGTKVFTYIVGFQLAGIAGRILASFLIDQIGRVMVIFIYGVAAMIALIIFGNQTSYMDLVIYGYIFSFFSDGGLSAIAPYTPELYPTRARATGVGWATGAGRIASILAPLAVGMLVPSGLSTVFLVLASGYLLAAIAVIIFRVETKKLFLEDASMET